MKITTGLRAWAVQNGTSPTASDAEISKQATKAMAAGTLAGSRYIELMGQDDPADQAAALKSAVRDEIAERFGPTERHSKGAALMTSGAPRVKAESDKYRADSRFIVHKSGYVPRIDGRPVETPSAQSAAKAGAFFKSFLRQSNPSAQPLSEHEHGLLREMAHESKWAGADPNETDGWSDPRRLKDYEVAATVKALIGDSGGASGGVNLVPVEFDEAIVLPAILSGEIAPFVDLKTMSRATIETPVMGSVSALWDNSVDGGTATLFSTAGLVSKLSSTAHSCSIICEVGRDLLADSPIDVAATLQGLFSETIAAELDGVCVWGDGSTMPLGMLLTPGITVIPSAGGGMSPITLGDLESLMFGVPKSLRLSKNRCAWIGSDAVYRRAKAMPVGQDDARRVLGDDYQSYQLCDWPYRVSPLLQDDTLAFCALSKYRLWRRGGVEMRRTSEGRALLLSNTELLSVRLRVAGRLVDASALAACGNLPLQE